MNIILIGFMGSGKSSIAPLLAARLGWHAVDMDLLVLAASGRPSIAEIFKHDGEPAFRTLEQTVAETLMRGDHRIIACGGGVVMNENTMRQLKTNSTVVFLNTSFSTIQKRLQGTTNRPLWNDKRKARDLFTLRTPLYRRYADITVSTDNQTPIAIIKNITKHIGGVI